MLGDEEMFASEPREGGFYVGGHGGAPGVAVAGAPGAPHPGAPYVIAKVLPAASVREETVIVLPATLSVPALAVE